jgi:hypothetical protein
LGGGELAFAHFDEVDEIRADFFGREFRFVSTGSFLFELDLGSFALWADDARGKVQEIPEVSLSV